MSWRNDLEIIGHHATTGGVWAGDQISKPDLRRLRHEGYIGYDDGRSVYVLTLAGKRTWARWSAIYSVWGWLKRLQWRVREFSTLSN